MLKQEFLKENERICYSVCTYCHIDDSKISCLYNLIGHLQYSKMKWNWQHLVKYVIVI